MKNTGTLYRSTEKTPTVFPEFRDLLPPLSQEQQEALEKDILQNGCYAPLIVDQELRVVDGHNRLLLCQSHEIPYTMLVFEFEDTLEAKQWALDTQKGRRNLDNWELGKIALKLKPELEARAKVNLSLAGQSYHPTEPSVNSQKVVAPINTVQEMADSVGLGQQTMHRIAQIDKNAPPSIKEALDNIEPIDDAYYDEPDMEQLHGSDLVYFREAILDGIALEQLPGESDRSLMAYFHGPDSVNQLEHSHQLTPKEQYNQIAPLADPDGFQLYWTARALTGIDVPSSFHYEDNCGMFEAASGHTLLRYLTALHFDAVQWEIVGGGYERAVLEAVDTSAPEYKAFEQKLYSAVLERINRKQNVPHKSTQKKKEGMTR